MSITRTADTDDSGAGVDGTIRNNAWKTAIYDQIDGRWSRATITSTGSQNNLSISEADLVVFNNATDLTITGIVAPASPAKPGKPFRFICIGAGNVLFTHQSASSTAANRLVNFATSGNTPCKGGTGTLAGGRGMFVYDDVNSRWQLVHHDQGGFLTATFAAGNFTGNGSMTWTVASGDVSTCAYRLSGTAMTVLYVLPTTTVAGTPNTTLQIGNGAWGSFTATKTVSGFNSYQDNGGARAQGRCFVLAAGTLVGIQTSTVANWTAATDATEVEGSITFEVT